VTDVQLQPGAIWPTRGTCSWCGRDNRQLKVAFDLHRLLCTATDCHTYYLTHVVPQKHRHRVRHPEYYVDPSKKGGGQDAGATVDA
jgi:hypothetical protein